MERYHIGLDIGTSSIGWAVIGDDFKIKRKKGKNLIGVRLFKEGDTAAERRSFRTQRRRLNRRKWRLKLLEEIFDPYMAEVDEYFFARLKESNLSPKDSNKKYLGSLLFPDISDSNFYDKYPTIYHLRRDLMEKDKKFDLREIYLAIHHIVKYRGNFLEKVPAKNYKNSGASIGFLLEEVNSLYKDIIGDESVAILNSGKFEDVEKIILDEETRNLDKQKSVGKLLVEDKKKKNIVTAFSKAILGYKFNIEDLLLIESDEKNKLTFNDENIDDIFNELSHSLDDNQMDLLTKTREIYFKFKLNMIVPTGYTLSESMIEKYEMHKAHLKMYKEFINTLNAKDRKILKNAYSDYINNEKAKAANAQENFYKTIKKTIKDNNSDTAKKIIGLIDEGNFMPKQRTGENGVIPHQLHQIELDRIIENQAKYYPWLAEENPVEKNRKFAKYKLDELVTFRVPYYVGPLVDKTESNKNEKETKFAWMVRKAKGTITPWNFENLVDRTESANRFIKRMTSKDTYIIGEDVLPASSLLYEKFKVLNELNNIKVNKKKLDVEQKQHVYLDLFTTRKNVTKDNLATSLNCDVESITGLSDNEKFNSSLSSYIDLKAILGNAVDDCNKNKDLEKIIEYSTIFEDGNIYKEKLSEISWLTDEQIEKLSNIHFKGWGRLSKKLLTQITNENGERIIDALWNTSNNFIQIISDESIQVKLAEINGEYADKSNLEDILDEAYTSPQNKKAIRQVMKVVEDIEKAMKCKPTSIAIEFTRRKGKSKLTNTRYKKISETYEKITDELISEYELGKLQSKLDSKANNMRDIYYLYFMQLGRDMYTGEKINIDELHQYYDIDHIFPRSFIKDNSLNNRVLTRKEINNNEKADRTAADLYAVKMGDFWRKLRKQGLITEKKYKNLLTRTDSIDKYTKQSFIKRQLVETSQVVKMAANILQDKYSNTKIIEVRARLNSDLRKEYELIKNREVNDYHHAIDGYLTIFIGQYLYKTYPKLRSYFVYDDFKKLDSNYLKHMDKFNFIWKLEDKKAEDVYDNVNNEFILNVPKMKDYIQKIYNYKYMLISKEVTTESGAFYKETKYKAGGMNLIPIKQNKPINIYGGYKEKRNSYMMLVKIKKKKETIYKIVGIPRLLSDELDRLNTMSEKQLLLETIARTSLSKTEQNFKIILDKIYYGQLVIDGNQKYTLGSVIYKHNAMQLHLSKQALEILAVGKTKSREVKDEELIAVYEEILLVVNKYFELYDISKFRQKLNDGLEIFKELPIYNIYENNKIKKIGKFEVLNRILIGLHANAARADLSVLGFKDLGKLQVNGGIKLSPDAKLIYQSPTGIFSRAVRVKDLG
ncbi:type II CRISPR RNA-guided endonuclease Cas9 [Ligilactobacillus salivarius]|uniref:CRISPR-associated endonuclease Cas9 n=1 Tax=Ligilactobacillus salivarius TaxID=1624 RepID=A0ABD6J452_9LACO|nr:type II CRISPR RNA-guided endonuclease Cas9 [Ligilactobacillus salivarius]MYU89471.1 type II CRISPR RNA-guided endonuclease Cas9 [Ligilactobacillus salivarius]MYU94545.1 type II CRISPR RNA-guided endonuclease Cas9 [Ligilactobacillus salivarius]MYY20947.1 type II CRISPR RNA-guided endonuclease Cas9 [Ligilactobacillus salivarius]MYY72795.1 type II CRISPR RNA-guided endonuclease Cas9 [Ligilactobacillus salivarius]MYY88266.1 type II CRISPR RNA-guided endonuclease Cas9 [Ligilactobacillus salivar